jgi:FkbM family methyltransferase
MTQTNNMFYSQIGQDEYYIKNIINYKQNGYYVDVGAHDGIKLSNTYYLEKNLNWTGICIEANEDLHQKLCVNRPNSINVNQLIYSQSDLELHFEMALNKEIVEGNDMLSRISNDEINAINHDYFTEQFIQSKTIKQKTKTLTDVLDAANAPNTIDYCSIDIEGAELACLEGIRFDKYKFLFITIEHGYREYFKNKIINRLCQNNYKLHRINQFDMEFVPM